MPVKRKTRKVPDNVKRYVKSQQTRALETKFYDRKNITLNPDYSGQIVDLTALITQGTTVATRVGDEITLRSIEWRGQIQYADTHNFVRFAIVRFKENNTGNIPLLSDWLETVADILAPTTLWSYDNKADIQVLWDKTYYVDNANKKAVQFAGKLGPQKLKTTVKYDPGVNSGRDHIYIVAISDSSAAAHPQVDYDMRVLYKDA